MRYRVIFSALLLICATVFGQIAVAQNHGQIWVDGKICVSGTVVTGGVWGTITGTVSNQLDLWLQLTNRYTKSEILAFGFITPATDTGAINIEQGASNSYDAETRTLTWDVNSVNTDIGNNTIDIENNRKNTAVNTIRTLINGSVSKTIMSAGVADAFIDQSGVDIGIGSNYFYNADRDYYAWQIYTNLPTDGLLAYFTFNETNASTTVTDETGNFDGTSISNNSLTTANGHLIRSVDTLGNRIVLADPGLGITGNVPFSVSVWIHNNNAHGEQFFWTVGGSGNNTHVRCFRKTGKNMIAISESDSTTWGFLDSSIDDAYWHMVTYTFDGTNSMLYFDGTRRLTQANTWNISGGTNYFRWGSDRQWNASALNSDHVYLDAGFIYNRALSSNEVWGLYNLGVGIEEVAQIGGNMLIQSTNGLKTFSFSPSKGFLDLFVQNVFQNLAVNTDFAARLSNDSGLTWDPVILHFVESITLGDFTVDWYSGTNILTGTGSNISVQVETFNEKCCGEICGWVFEGRK